MFVSKIVLFFLLFLGMSVAFLKRMEKRFESLKSIQLLPFLTVLCCKRRHPPGCFPPRGSFPSAFFFNGGNSDSGLWSDLPFSKSAAFIFPRSGFRAPSFDPALGRRLRLRPSGVASYSGGNVYPGVVDLAFAPVPALCPRQNEKRALGKHIQGHSRCGYADAGLYGPPGLGLSIGSDGDAVAVVIAECSFGQGAQCGIGEDRFSPAGQKNTFGCSFPRGHTGAGVSADLFDPAVIEPCLDLYFCGGRVTFSRRHPLSGRLGQLHLQHLSHYLYFFPPVRGPCRHRPGTFGLNQTAGTSPGPGFSVQCSPWTPLLPTYSGPCSFWPRWDFWASPSETWPLSPEAFPWAWVSGCRTS